MCMRMPAFRCRVTADRRLTYVSRTTCACGFLHPLCAQENPPIEIQRAARAAQRGVIGHALISTDRTTYPFTHPSYPQRSARFSRVRLTTSDKPSSHTHSHHAIMIYSLGIMICNHVHRHIMITHHANTRRSSTRPQNRTQTTPSKKTFPICFSHNHAIMIYSSYIMMHKHVHCHIMINHHVNIIRTLVRPEIAQKLHRQKNIF